MAKHFTPEFGDFVRDAEPHLRQAFVATVGVESARRATIDALLDVWGQWGEFDDADGAVRSGYQAGCRAVGSMPPPPVSSPRIDHIFYELPWDERAALLLSSGYGWTDEEIANLLVGSVGEVAARTGAAAESLQRDLGLQRRDLVDPFVTRRARELDEAVRPVGLVDLAGSLKAERSLGLVPTGRRPSGHWWLAIAAAVALLVIFLPLLSTGSGTTEPDDTEDSAETVTTEIFAAEPTEPTEPEASDEETTTVTYRSDDSSSLLPDEPGTYPISTALGTWTWTRFDLDEPGGGWDVHHHQGRLYAMREDGLWASVDGIEWNEMASPLSDGDEGWVHLLTVGDELWGVVSSEGEPSLSTYRYVGDSWVLVVVPDMEPPQTPGIIWNGPHLDSAATYAGAVVVPLNFWGSVDWGAIYGTFEVSSWGPGDIPPQPPEADLYGRSTVRVMHPDTGETIDELTVDVGEGSPTLVEFRRKETGELVHTVVVEVTGPVEDLLPQLIWGGLQHAALMVDSGSGFEIVDVPWAEDRTDMTAVVAAPFGLVAATMRQWDEAEEGTLNLWRSSDGINWVDGGSPDIGSGVDWLVMHDAGDRLMMMVSRSAGYREEITFWTSSDGVAWAQTDIEIRDGYPDLITATERGYVMSVRTWSGADQGERLDVWLSEDGVSWDPVEQSPNIAMRSEGWSSVWMLGDRLFVTRSTARGDSTLWVGEFEN